jgi:hypothetical protein
MMIAVGVVALLLAVGSMIWRWDQVARQHESAATEYAREERYAKRSLAALEKDLASTLVRRRWIEDMSRKYGLKKEAAEVVKSEIAMAKLIERESARGSYWGFMKTKYRRAAARPWLPVEPDPPPPE